ncbi:PHB depolymerase family esterase [Sphingobium sp. CR2-8]|uniref:extracellular catalytic domain type 1 short-chain-length polyhydroxyalkanoate depolymerase n=1 Tax=Sphingobium sp. CR2-8 TaxID=1306534 RepID=UPI002DB5F5B0|nr:PHB depolymerase family esterase [Sphingobium sp. CR2-8]MEC3909371.1 PHB depolymerase family esterase [Sphingobium sp. CR2-8]
MRKLSATIAQLAAMRTVGMASVANHPDRLQDLQEFGSNPGALKAKTYVPETRKARPALVVVLHGCTQTAGGYDHGSGWSRLADDHGFILLFPEQQRANNPNLCFNWFSREDITRDRGEALSIRQMIATMVDTRAIDPSRIFVTGLSAGGAMAAALLATYPELFAGGAIIAGLPYGSASNIPEALQAMRDPGKHSGTELGDRVRRASPHVGPWPGIAIWHGTADATVTSSNADASLAQWLSVHGLDDKPNATETVSGHQHRIWTNATGRPVVEDYRIANLGHGTPLATTGEDACGNAMPHMLEAGISSTRRIAAAWGLLADTESHAAPRRMESPPLRAVAPKAPTRPIHDDPTPASLPKTRVQKVIEDALRSAGLMR